MSSFKLVSAAVIMSACLHASASANPTTYDDLPSFLANTTNLTLETFDASPWDVGPPLTQPVINLGVSWTAAENLQAVTSLFVSPLQAITSADDDTGTTDAIQAVLPGGRHRRWRLGGQRGRG